MELVTLEHRGPVAVLTLDRPKALNALDTATLEAICPSLRRDRRQTASFVPSC